MAEISQKSQFLHYDNDDSKATVIPEVFFVNSQAKPLPDKPILGSPNSRTNKDMTSKI